MAKSLDRLTLLSTFVRIAERGSISAAARDLGMAQASASRQLAELEQRLGVQLIQRTTHHLALTEAGRGALAEARALIIGWDALEEQYREDEVELSGGLKIVAPVALGQIYLVEAGLEFQRSNPLVSFTWLLDDSPIKFAEIGCDLWIKIGRPSDETLVLKELANVERLVVAAPSLLGSKKNVSPGDLAEVPCAALGPFEAGAIPLTHVAGDTLQLNARVSVATNNIFCAHKAALMGIGFAVMPRWFVDGDLADGSLVDVLPDWRAPSLTITASYLPARRQTRRLRAVLKHLHHTVCAIPGLEATP